ncbi:hypothetical protein PYCC9005_003783 [Savitreella phatthalungensis]
MENGAFSSTRAGGSGGISHAAADAPIAPLQNEKITHALDQAERELAHPHHHDSSSSIVEEKVDEKAQYEVTSSEKLDDDVPSNLYPFPDLPHTDQDRQLTFRAIIIGCALGAVVSASNLYLGLKTGWTFGASLFGGILGFAILKPLSRVLPPMFGGGHFSPKENVTVQTAATASGGLGIIFVGAIPAMYQMNLLGESPQHDFWRLFTFSACTAYYGLFFAIALRKFYILKLKLIFPSPTAMAYVIRALHAQGGEGEAAGKRKAKALAAAFGLACLWRVISIYAPGILWDHHIFWWLYTWGWKSIISADNWNWSWEWTPAFIGAGVLSGLNASWSFFGGSVLAWALIGPLTVKYGATFGVKNPDIPGMVAYTSLKLKDPIHRPSPRYWNLWVGIMVMLCASFAEVGCNGPIIYRAVKRVIYDTAEKVPATRQWAARKNAGSEPAIPDPQPPSEQVPTWMWTTGVVISIIFSCIVLALQYQVSVGLTILAVILAFIFSFIAGQSSGATDINPVSTCAKASQIVFGGVTQGQHLHGTHALRTNVIGGIVSGGAAAQSVDMLGDLRTGYLISASPYVQFIAQACGAFCSIWLCTGFFVLFSKAYPCIVDVSYDTCSFGIPSVSAWRATAIAVTSNSFPVPKSSAITALMLGLASIAIVCAKYFLIPERYHVYVPNMNAVGLAFTLPQTWYSTAMAFGSTLSYIWLKKHPSSWNEYAYAVAAGFAAGEGIGGVVNAVLQVAKVSGDYYGSSVGCPGWEYCG